MAGHSKFKNIQHRKGAQDKKRGKIFTRILRDIQKSIRSGGAIDPEYNPKLRHAINKAREVNLPKDRIEKAIQTANNPQTDNYDEIIYEAFGPSGIAMVIEVLSDNRNRAASDVRSILTKYGGNLGESGSVSFMFDRLGFILYQGSLVNDVSDAAIDLDVFDIEADSDAVSIFTQFDKLHAVYDALQGKFGDAQECEIVWRPKSYIQVSKDAQEKAIKLIDALEDNDDVQNVFSNLDAT